MMSVDELFKVVDTLSERDFDHLFDRVLFLHASRKNPVLPPEETALLLTINQGIPSELNQRYEWLLEKRDDETISPEESQELLIILNQIEALGVDRLKALASLAQIRQVNLLQLMQDLGIESPGVR
jgi:hypothetical protein